jgi:hypothetical protein
VERETALCLAVSLTAPLTQDPVFNISSLCTDGLSSPETKRNETKHDYEFCGNDELERTRKEMFAVYFQEFAWREYRDP